MVRRVFRLMYGEVRGLHQAAYLLAFFAFGSQMLALVRDRALAHRFGAGGELDIYYAAFRVPDLLFVVFASVLSVYVLLPFVSRAVVGRGDVAGKEVLSSVFSLFLYCYAAVALVLFFLAPLLLPFLFPGLAERSDELVLLTRILLLQPFLLGVSTLCGVITQMQHRFVLYAVSPLLYNVGIIFGVLALYPSYGLAGLVFGVVLGALGHLLVQVPLLLNSPLRFALARIDWSLVRDVLWVSIPRTITLSIHQLVLFVFIAAATTMAVGSVSVFQFAFNLQSVPLAIIGMSYSVAAFPTLADLIARKERELFNTHVLTALRHIIFWSLPIIGLVVVLRAQLVRVILGSGSFDWSDTRLTAAVLALLVVSLAAQAILLLLIRAFYAAGQTRVPLYIALCGALGTLSLGAFLQHVFVTNPGFREGMEMLLRLTGVPGTEVLVLALAFALGAIVEALIMFTVFARAFSLPLAGFVRQLGEAVLATLVGAFTAYATLIFIVDGVNQETFLGILLQGAVAGTFGLAAVFATYALCGSKELAEIYRSFHAKIFKTNIIAPQSDTL